MRALHGLRFGASPAEWATRIFWICAWIAIMAFLAPRFVVGADQQQVWRTDFEAAQQEAESKRLPLLVHFYADWCMPCKRMEQTVFSTPAVREMLSTRFIAVKVNSDHHPKLVQRYGVDVLPADLVLDPITGHLIKLHTGIMEQPQYVAMLSQVETSFAKAHPVVPKTTATAVASATTVDPANTPQLGDPKPIVGLDGFSPVALTKSRQWVKGSAKFTWDHKGVVYYLSTREEQIEFRKNPEAYAPRLLGCDPVILWETDRAVAGNIEFGAFFDDELYLFKSDERRKQFKANPEKFTRLQHALKASQIERTVLR